MGRPFITPLAHEHQSSENYLKCSKCENKLFYGSEIIRDDY